MSTDFASLGLGPILCGALSERGYTAPTAIQQQAIPVLLGGADVIGQAQTGTGKTAAFALPLLERMEAGTHAPQLLVLVPTRELAVQVSNAIYDYGKCLDIHALAIYGGSSYGRQKTMLSRGPQVVVGTPGRTQDLITQGVLDLSAVRAVVLDEADEMLRMGFLDEVENILKPLPPHQTALFSATFSPQVRRLAERYMQKPVSVTVHEKTMTVAQTTQRHYVVEPASKVALLTRLLEVETITRALIFTRMRVGAAELAESLQTRGFAAEALHGDMDQDARKAALGRFRRGVTTYLVATDVASRGLDVAEVSHVINFDMADKPEEYVHRIGRTGRAGQNGVALSLVTPAERGLVQQIQCYTRHTIARAIVPTVAEVVAMREARLFMKLDAIRAEQDLSAEREAIAARVAAGEDPIDIAAAALRLARGPQSERPLEDVVEWFEKKRPASPAPVARNAPRMQQLSFELGRKHGIKPRDVVSALTRDANVPGPSIGDIDVGKHRTLVQIAEAHVSKVLSRMRSGSMKGQPVQFVRA